MDLEVEDESLIEHESKLIFSKFSRVRQLLLDQSKTTPTRSTGVRLPKLDIALYNGDITCWIAFWEQFSISVHDCKDIEKLAYLRNAVKDGSAKHVVEGLSSSSDQYLAAIQCLKERYECSRLIHHTHVRAILDAPCIKEGELRRLHDTANQHLRALKAMKYDPSGLFITSTYLGIKARHHDDVGMAKTQPRVNGSSPLYGMIRIPQLVSTSI